MNVSNKSLLPTFDPISLEKVGESSRNTVHVKGLWHKGIQAHVIRANNNSFDIFVQQRSEIVDISALKMDQSLATQMINKDGLNEDKTLKRGLKQELEIIKFTAVRLPLNLRIIKRYAKNPSILNNEIISLFLVKSDQEPNFTHCTKIHRGRWMTWEKLIKQIVVNKSNFTKTAQMYLLNSELRRMIEICSRQFLKMGKISLKTKSVVYTGILPAKGDTVYRKFNNNIKLKMYLNGL